MEAESTLLSALFSFEQGSGCAECILSLGFLNKENIVATNPPKGDGHRNGAVRNRTQVFNPQNKTWTKRDSETGKFMDQKADGDPFKGVTKEKP